MRLLCGFVVKDPSLIEEHLDKFFSNLTCTWWLASSLDRRHKRLSDHMRYGRWWSRISPQGVRKWLWVHKSHWSLLTFFASKVPNPIFPEALWIQVEGKALSDGCYSGLATLTKGGHFLKMWCHALPLLERKEHLWEGDHSQHNGRPLKSYPLWGSWIMRSAGFWLLMILRESVIYSQLTVSDSWLEVMKERKC